MFCVICPYVTKPFTLKSVAFCKLASHLLSVREVGRVVTDRPIVRLHVDQREGRREDCQEVGEERSRSRDMGLVSFIRYKSACFEWIEVCI